MGTGRKEVGPVIFSDYSGGLATAEPAHAIKDNQASETLNVIFQKHGILRAPGLSGIKNEAIFTAPLRGWFKYKLPSGTDKYLAVVGFKLYDVTTSDGTLTELHTMQSDAECFGVNYHGKFWIVNGTDVIKIESDLSVYRIGIVAPTSGFSASAVAGGTLPVGDYGVYVSYSRQVGGTTILHSAPLYVGVVTVDGTQKISVSTIASSDSQVSHITVWMTAADGSVYYWYAEGTNATGTIEIASDSINEDLVMLERCAGNQVPGSLKTIYAHGGRLFGTVNSSNEIYYSYQAQNVYDLERWPTEYHIPTIPFVALSFFAIGKNLYVNTVGGPFVFEGGDIAAKPDPIIQGAGNNQILYFPWNMLKTIQEYNNLVYGITSDGFRYFDGIQFSIDLSKHIKPEIDKITNGAGTYNPYGIIHRRSGKRTEYQVSYRDDKLSADCHNRTLVLNLDTLLVVDNDNYRAAWEMWGHGYGGAVVSAVGTLIVAQFSSYSGTIANETGKSLLNCFNDHGVFVTTLTAKRLYNKSKMKIIELAGMDLWQILYYLAKLQSDCTINLLIPDTGNYRDSMIVSSTLTDPAILDAPGNPLILPFVLSPDNPINSYEKASILTRGNSIIVEIDQTANDEEFRIDRLELYGMHERSNCT